MKNTSFNGKTPGPNYKQNEQTNSIAAKLGLSPEGGPMLHEEVTGRGYGYQEILKIAKDIAGGKF